MENSDGKRALVIGASGGIGRALCAALDARGLDVEGLSRSRDGFDLTQPDTVEAALGAVAPGVDMILVASGILTGGAARPEKALREVSAEEMAAQFAVNAIGPALVLRHAKRLLPRDRRGIFAALSARVGSIGDNRAGGWYAYRAAKAALNQIVHTGAIELARSHKQAVCVCLHPGTVETRFTADYSAHDKVLPKVAAGNLLSVLDGVGPADTGGFYDWTGKRVPW